MVDTADTQTGGSFCRAGGTGCQGRLAPRLALAACPAELSKALRRHNQDNNPVAGKSMAGIRPRSAIRQRPAPAFAAPASGTGDVASQL